MFVPRGELEFNTVYWVCDTAMASGNTSDNVFEYNPTYFSRALGENIIITDSSYLAFTTKAEALDLSARMIKDENLMFELNKLYKQEQDK